jgi:hypothetical protein
MGVVGSAEEERRGETNNICATGFDWMSRDMGGAKRDPEHMAGINGECGSTVVADHKVNGRDEHDALFRELKSPRLQCIQNPKGGSHGMLKRNHLETMPKQRVNGHREEGKMPEGNADHTIEMKRGLKENQAEDRQDMVRMSVEIREMGEEYVDGWLRALG